MIRSAIAVGFAGLLAVGSLAAATPDECRMLVRHGKTDSANACFTALVHSDDPFLQAEGYWGLQQYASANNAFRSAVARQNDNALVRVRWGLLLHERFNNTDASGLFDEALKIDPANALAYYGKALVSSDGFDENAEIYGRRALELDPKLTAAHELMASLALEDDNTAAAIQQADAALALSPDALDAMAVHAAIEVLADRSPDAWLAKMLAVNPLYGNGLEIIAYHLVINRRYVEATDYYRKAIGLDAGLWSAHSELGVNLMRLGQVEEPQQELQLAYDNGYRNPATVNSLKLLDSFKSFTTYKDGDVILKLQNSEAELLHPYFLDLTRRAMAVYEKKYQFKLPGPVQVEAFKNHDDFAVRALGLPGLGAMGVTFDRVLAMDSPSAQPPGEFNWGSVLWHELDHVYVLTITHDRIPRWFAEGLAVHEEGDANPAWANRLTPHVVAAIRDKKLLPVTELDRGFVRPDYPEQVVVSYYQAGRICDFIQSKWGDDGLLKMIHSFSVPASTGDVIQADLGLSPQAFDTQFQQWLNQDVGAVVAAFAGWADGIKALVELERGGQWDALAKAAEHVRDQYPQYVDDANAYSFLAEAADKAGNQPAAVSALSQYVKMGGGEPDLFKTLANDQVALQRPADAAATLDQLNYIYPLDEALHRQLGDLYLALKNYPGATREYGAVVAMHPLDTASAQYNLAQAFLAGGDLAGAEKATLAALEAAPGFKPAQKLLLDIEDLKKGIHDPHGNPR